MGAWRAGTAGQKGKNMEAVRCFSLHQSAATTKDKLSLRYGCVKRSATYRRSHLKQAAANCGVAERYECMLSCRFVRLFFPFPRHSGPARSIEFHPSFMSTPQPQDADWVAKDASTGEKLRSRADVGQSRVIVSKITLAVRRQHARGMQARDPFSPVWAPIHPTAVPGGATWKPMQPQPPAA